MSLLTQQTPIELWQTVVQDASQHCAIRLEQDLEYYLIAILMRHTDKPDTAQQLYAQAFLEAMQKPKQAHLLQAVGDQCLVLSGLFPAWAEKRTLSLRYFVSMGQAAYAELSVKTNDLFALLARQFVQLMDVLQAIRPETQLSPIGLYEQWQELGSLQAYRLLGRNGGTPVLKF